MTGCNDTRGAVIGLLALGLLGAPAACGPERADPTPEPPAHVDDEPPRLPAELTDLSGPPDPDILLPPIAGYSTDDEAEPGELEASLDHGSIPYVDVRRRIILDEQGFASAEVAVVTVRPGTDGAERVLDHRYGDADLTPVRIGGVPMLLVDTTPHPALAWIGPTFAVTFERGQERSHAWLEELARATVEAIAQRES